MSVDGAGASHSATPWGAAVVRTVGFVSSPVTRGRSRPVVHGPGGAQLLEDALAEALRQIIDRT